MNFEQPKPANAEGENPEIMELDKRINDLQHALAAIESSGPRDPEEREYYQQTRKRYEDMVARRDELRKNE